MKHIQSFESYNLNENIFQDAWNSIKSKVNNWKNKAAASYTNKALEIINKSPELQEKIKNAQEKIAKMGNNNLANIEKSPDTFLANIENDNNVKSLINKTTQTVESRRYKLNENFLDKVNNILPYILKGMGITTAISSVLLPIITDTVNAYGTPEPKNILIMLTGIIVGVILCVIKPTKSQQQTKSGGYNSNSPML